MKTEELAQLSFMIEDLQKENRDLKERFAMLKYQHSLGFIHFDNEDDVSLLDLSKQLHTSQ
jgi:ribosomal protein L29